MTRSEIASKTVKRSWKQAKLLHFHAKKELEKREGETRLEGIESTPAKARAFNSLKRKGQIANAPKHHGLAGKEKRLAQYMEYLSYTTPKKEVPVDRPYKMIKRETLGFVPIVPLLENLSQTCREFQVTPSELVAHAKVLEQLQVLDTTCVQEAVPEDQANATVFTNFGRTIPKTP